MTADSRQCVHVLPLADYIDCWSMGPPYKAVAARADAAESEVKRIGQDLRQERGRLTAVDILLEFARWPDHARLVAAGKLTVAEAAEVVWRYRSTPDDTRTATRLSGLAEALAREDGA